VVRRSVSSLSAHPLLVIPESILAAPGGGKGNGGKVGGDVRTENAKLTIKDDNGETWIVHFGTKASGDGSFFAPDGDDVVVTRLHNVDSDEDGSPDNPGKSQWEFSTTGLGYVYRDNNPPHSPTEFWGVVTLSFSGTIESLTDELEPGT
jgi:hypothetical protein